MLRKYSQTVLRVAGFAAFTFFAFLVSLFFVFPYGALSEYLVSKAKQARIHLSIDSLKPAFFGIEAKGIQIGPEFSKPETNIGRFQVDSLSIKPNPFFFNLTANVKIANGNIQLATGLFNQQNLTAKAKGVDLSRINFPALLWALSPDTYSSGGVTPKLEVEGVLTHAQVSLFVPQNQGAAEANGSWNIEVDGLTLKQGTLAIPWPDSTESVPVDLPRVVLGSLKSAASIKKGLVQIAHTKTQSDELSCEVLGTVQLAKRLAYSEADFTLRLQVKSELLGRLGMFGSAVSLLPVDPQDAEWRKAQWSGQLSRLRMK